MLGGRDRAAGVRWSPHICGRGVVIIIIMKLWPASEPWSWYMYENGRELIPGERAQHARQHPISRLPKRSLRPPLASTASRGSFVRARSGSFVLVFLLRR